jgi:hypothetical protein
MSKTPETFEERRTRLQCFDCGKYASTVIPGGTIIRATLTCPECETKEAAAHTTALEAAKREARLDEAAELHKLGFDILRRKGAAAVVVGGTELDELLNVIERRHGKDMILHVGGKHNRPHPNQPKQEGGGDE